MFEKLFVKKAEGAPKKVFTYYPQTFWEQLLKIKKIHERYLLDKKGLQGEYTCYDEFGQLERKCHYKDGKLDGPYKDYYFGEKICTECSYKNGKYEGLFIRYSSNGRITLRCNYKNGILDGLYETFYDSGVQNCRCLYKDGKQITENKLSLERRGIDWKLDEVNRQEKPTQERQHKKRELVKAYRKNNPHLNSGR